MNLELSTLYSERMEEYDGEKTRLMQLHDEQRRFRESLLIKL